jgi:hypothetical protein
MNPYPPILALCFVLLGAAAMAQERAPVVRHAQPSLLRYALARSSTIATRQVEPVRVDDGTREKTVRQVTYEPFEPVFGLSLTDPEEPSGTPASLSFDVLKEIKPSSLELMIGRLDLIDRPKFSFGNLIEGALYDFEKSNNLRFEIGPSPCENGSDFRYEEPFFIALFLRFKL